MALCSDTSEFGAVVADYDLEHVAFRRVVDDFSRECLATVVDTSLGACASCANSNSSDLRGCARTCEPSAVNCRPAAPRSPSVEMEHVTDRTYPWALSWYRKDFALARGALFALAVVYARLSCPSAF
jgi:hypothetical protein